ncbi:TPA: hypothetical protein L6A41_22795 [Pseudomonas aeruginosa]|nr:hypothetical protein EJP70_00505 [Pseudomonas aeruginosa]TJY58708.1 hypothetical protein FCG96_00100 [Pseudomonas aeruginosa]TRP00454.1 hypothetical protein FNL71_25935 [Pseudomonas aeruginosa]HBP5966535.1 hypothetical protein [Pseudomonas aeruginosa]HBP5974028.1 hypothetical protein [Pseudomonas aeruginosa]
MREKVTKTLCPCIRPRLRRGSLIPSALRGLTMTGHPWPGIVLAASMPLDPLRADSARPSDGAFGVA